MLCPRCNKNPATVHVIEVVEFVRPGDESNELETHEMCEVCAQAADLPSGMPAALAHGAPGGPSAQIWDLLQNAKVQVKVKQKPAEPGPTCPACGMTLAELQRKGRVGCEADYEVFAPYLMEVLDRMHGAHEHVGRMPGVEESEFAHKERKGELERALELAIRKEDYESAARLRDELDALGGQTAEGGGP